MLPQQPPTRVQIPHPIPDLLRQRENRMSLGEVQPDDHEQLLAAQRHQRGVRPVLIHVHPEHVGTLDEPLPGFVPELMVDVHTHGERRTCHATNGDRANSAQFVWATGSDKQQVDKYAHYGLWLSPWTLPPVVSIILARHVARIMPRIGTNLPNLCKEVR